MKRVLIISYSFPPYNNIAARRYGSIAKYMNEYGWQPYILTTNSEGTLPVEIDEQFILRVGTRIKNDNTTDKTSRDDGLPIIISTIKRFTSKINFRFRTVDRSIMNWYPIVKKNIRHISEYVEKSDIIIASYGPPAALWIGKYLSKRYNKPWIADIRDLGALRSDNRNKISIWIDKMIEKLIFSTASGIIAVSNTLETILNYTYKKNTKTIYNGWDRMERDATGNVNLSISHNMNDSQYIYYAGVFYNHRLNSIQLLLEALSDIDNKSLILVIRSLGPKDMEDKIIEMAKKNNIEDRVVILEACSPEIVEHEQNNATVNLVVEDLNTLEDWSRGTLTGKFLELIIRKAPVLAIARNDSEIGDILKDTRKGRLCSEKEEIKEFLNDINFNNEKYIGDYGKINKYSKKNQAKELSIFLDRTAIKTK